MNFTSQRDGVGMNTNTRTYQSINSYGVIGDCHSVVLVAPDGSVDWGCLPDFDSPAIFCRLLDAERGGYFQIAPTEGTIPGVQRYLRGSNVLQTRFTSTVGEIILTDFMPVETLSAWQYRELNNNTWTREDGSCHCLVRIVECTHGELPITMTLKASPDYASATSEVSLIPGGMGAVISGGRQHVGLGVVGAYRLPSFSMSVRQDDGETHPSVIVQATLQEGERLLFAVGMGRNARAARRLAEEELHLRNFDWELAHTLHCWRTWIESCSYRGPYQDLVQRSALVLKMMTYAPTGAIVAAPTASLPEGIGGVRNWDYRFTWLRDSAFTLNSLLLLGFSQEAEAFMAWLMARVVELEAGGSLQPMYTIHGGHDMTEHTLDHLEGYRQSQPVRIGNGAYTQQQLDVYGEVMDALSIYNHYKDMSHTGWVHVRQQLDWLSKNWQSTDEGIWEVRGGDQHFVHSRVMSWVAFDRALRIARDRGFPAPEDAWTNIRAQIYNEIMDKGWSEEKQSFVQYYGGDAIDASALLISLTKFTGAADPRIRSTIDWI